ncbi:serine protease [Streptomyces diastatochromogenes]|nr:serine protease [Streptomyces diastatochromogenes]
MARIEEEDGRVLGAGVLLAPDRVLTAAHVVRPGRPYVVHFVGVPGVPGVAATVRADEHVPQRKDAFGDRSGDLALLRLADPLPAEHTARLYRLASPHGPVSMYGFLDGGGDDGGRWHGATLVAARGRDHQVQLRPQTLGEPAAPGFSGGGVVDHETDEVIGIVLRVDEGPGSVFSCMSPTETILSHLPQAAAWSDGAEAVDPALRPARRAPPPGSTSRSPPNSPAGSGARAGRCSSPSSRPAARAPGPSPAPSPWPTGSCAPSRTPAPSATTRPRPCPRSAATISPWTSRT